MSLLRLSGSGLMFAGTALAIETVDAKSAAAARILTIPTICFSLGQWLAPLRQRFVVGQVPVAMALHLLMSSAYCLSAIFFGAGISSSESHLFTER
jgi:hypothetical protein